MGIFPSAGIIKSLRQVRIRYLVLPGYFILLASAQAQQEPPAAVTPWPSATTTAPVTAPAAQAPVTGPVQYQVVAPNPQIASTHQDNNKLPSELLAILQSVFGIGSNNRAGNSNSSCGGSSEIACAGDDTRESYSTDSFANVRPTGTSDLTSPFKILGPFKKYFDGCIEKAGLGTCRFVNLGVKGDASHQKRRSCHNSAQAIDVGPLTCSSGRKILASDPKYFEVAKCMANQANNELQVIFYKSEGSNMIQKSDHNNHMHIQIKNCSMVFG